MKSVVAYLRVSGKSQVEGDGFPRQVSAVQACCDSKELKLIRQYREEAVSGKLDEDSRPAFQDMVSDLLNNGCRTIIVESLDRLARQYDIQQRLAEYLASKGLTLISANTGEDITAALLGDPMRRAMVQMQGIFAELDKNMIVAKLRKARMRKKAATGHCEGRKPYGHRPGEQAIIERILALRKAGTALDAIADTLNSEGIAPRAGGKWYGSAVNNIVRRAQPAA